ncbi:hypothetical protein CR513_02961, partial [Mucuna pruriens]
MGITLTSRAIYKANPKERLKDMLEKNSSWPLMPCGFNLHCDPYLGVGEYVRPVMDPPFISLIQEGRGASLRLGNWLSHQS